MGLSWKRFLCPGTESPNPTELSGEGIRSRLENSAGLGQIILTVKMIQVPWPGVAGARPPPGRRECGDGGDGAVRAPLSLRDGCSGSPGIFGLAVRQVRAAERDGGAPGRRLRRLRRGAGGAAPALRAGIRRRSHGLRGDGRHHSRGTDQVGPREWPFPGPAGTRAALPSSQTFPSPLSPRSGNGKLASWTSILGFVVMMSLDVGLG